MNVLSTLATVARLPGISYHILAGIFGGLNYCFLYCMGRIIFSSSKELIPIS